MTLSRRFAVAVLLAGAGLVLSAPGAGAHALLQSSGPAAGTELDESPESITLTFTEEPERGLSNIRVLDASGSSFASGDPAAEPGQPRTLRVPVRELPDGVYTVAWRVVSRVDGHVTGGAFAFGVGVSPENAPPPAVDIEETPPVSITELTGRWLLYVGFFGLLGSAWVSVISFTTAPAGSRRFTAASWTIAVIGVLLLALAQRDAAGVGFGELASTAIGRALLWRLAAIGGAGIALIAAARLHGRAGRLALIIAGAAAAGGALAHVAAGHAAASEPAWRNVASQFAHLLAAGIWIGGLAVLLIGIHGIAPEPRSVAVRRYSAAAGVALAVVLATGTVRAFAEVGSWSGLTSSTYGRLVIAKVILIAGLATLGAVNRYRNVPRAGADPTGLRRVSRGELALGALAIAAAAGLASTSPPADAEVSGPERTDRLVATATDFAETIRVTLEVAPGFPGQNTFVLRVSEPVTGDPIDANRVNLRFRFRGESVGVSELTLEQTASGVYEAGGANLSLDGLWTITAVIQQATDSVEISLDVATRCRAQPVPAQGGPTLYNLPVATGSAQLYVDPATAGQNEVHVTFFTPDGGELPVEDAPTISGTLDDGVTEFEVRRFGPGHFVADATLEAGDWRFAFSGTAGGQTVTGCFEETIP